MSKQLFEKVFINDMSLQNRFVLSAAFDADVERFKMLADGDIGLIITGGTALEDIKSFEEIIRIVQEKDGKIVLQLVTHVAGLFGYGDNVDTVAVSELSKKSSFFNAIVKYSKNHTATEEEIKIIIDSYVQAAVLAKKIGADGVQLHSAHQSFLQQFLSPITNKRTDRWGGSLENRTRIHKIIYDAIREKLGKNYPILIKLGLEDSLPDGLKLQEGKKIAKIMSAIGFDALEISQGLQDFERVFSNNDWSGTPMKCGVHDEGYYRSWCSDIKKDIVVPIIMTGGLRSYDLMQVMLDKNEADLFGLCRPFIREPKLIKRWKDGDLKKASCISCNKCVLDSYMRGEKLRCFLEK
jgi:2,4-dienoyl-CoA reductase-like NADH-dependent reductase (Old Yellow Enzyme family)